MSKLLLRIKSRVVTDKRLPFRDSVLFYKVVDLQTREVFNITPDQITRVLGRYSLENAIYQSGILRQKPGKVEIQTIEKRVANSVLPDGLIVRTKAIPTEDKERFCYKQLDDFLYNSNMQKILGICGLRRTGKTVMMEQAFNKSLSKNIPAVFITIETNSEVTVSDLQNVIKMHIDNGVKHIYIDEITFLKDFQTRCSGLGDVYAKFAGVRIIISGTFSLSMLAASKGTLYDRIILIDTSYVSFREFKYLIGGNLSSYIETACRLNGLSSNKNKNDNYEDTHDYVSTSIVENVEFSLSNSKYSAQYRDLHRYFNNRDIATILFRVLDYLCVRWTDADFNLDFESNILGSAKEQCEQKGIAFDEDKLSDILSDFMYNFGLQRSNLLQNIAKEDAEILKEYLSNLGVRASSSVLDSSIEPMVIQYGLVYSYTKQLIDTITRNIQNEKVIDKNTMEILKDHLNRDTHGKLLENIILYETTMALRNNNNVTVKQFTLPAGKGEVDMVISYGNMCELFEIKWNANVNEKQYRWLIDRYVESECTRRFGTIRNRIVLYMGKSRTVKIGDKSIKYCNAEQYLLKLKT